MKERSQERRTLTRRSACRQSGGTSHAVLGLVRPDYHRDWSPTTDEEVRFWDEAGEEVEVVSRVSPVLALLLAVGLLAFAQGQLAGAQDATPEAGLMTSPTATDVRYLLPFTPEGLHPGFTVTETVEGRCGGASLVAHDRPDAWDCISPDNEIYDPCFEQVFPPLDEPGQVVCIASPFDTEVIMLTLTEPLERDKEVPEVPDGAAPNGDMGMPRAEADIDGEDLPWGLELANGERCSLLRGTLIAMAGQVVYYGCTDGGMVLGEMIREQPLWTVNYVPEGGAASTRVAVITAWM